MKNNEKIYDFLKSKGLEQTKSDTSLFFGDYYDIFANDIFQLRFSRSKSFDMIDIRNNQPKENWYDLSLVKALLYNEKTLNYVMPIEEYGDFLQKDFSHIVRLFNRSNYLTTKKRLEELGNERAKQMFPTIRI